MAETGTSKRLSGRCLCGGVRFSAAPSRMRMSACHCAMCRRWASGPFFAVPCGETVEFTEEGKLTYFRSSQWAERGFCADCGTVLVWRMHDGDDLNVSAHAFDDAEKFEFGTELFIDEKPTNYAFANDTKQMTGAQIMAAFRNEAKDAS